MAVTGATLARAEDAAKPTEMHCATKPAVPRVGSGQELRLKEQSSNHYTGTELELPRYWPGRSRCRWRSCLRSVYEVNACPPRPRPGSLTNCCQSTHCARTYRDFLIRAQRRTGANGTQDRCRVARWRRECDDIRKIRRSSVDALLEVFLDVGCSPVHNVTAVVLVRGRHNCESASQLEAPRRARSDARGEKKARGRKARASMIR